MQDSVQTVPLR